MRDARGHPLRVLACGVGVGDLDMVMCSGCGAMAEILCRWQRDLLNTECLAMIPGEKINSARIQLLGPDAIGTIHALHPGLVGL